MDKQYSNSSINNNNNNNNLSDCWQNIEILEKLNVHNVGMENENLYRDSYRWKDLYKKIDIEKSFEKIQSIRFNESIKHYGFECIPSSSGYGLGSANWVIESKGFERVVYISDSSLSLSRYPTPFQLSPIDNPDVLILSKINHYPNNPPDQMLSELCSNIGSTLQQGGTVLIPSYSCGIILDLFEHLADYLNKVGLPYVPIYFVSSVSKAVLSYADIYSEWLNKSKQERAFMPETPFLHQDLMRKGQFQAYQHVHSNFQANDPCIIFTGHPSCRIGDITTLIKLYDNPKNSILLIEPDFDFKSTVLPFSKQISRIQFLPIDPRINFNEANLLISKLSPKHLIIPRIYKSKLLKKYTYWFFNTNSIIYIQKKKDYVKNKHSNGNFGIVTTILPLDTIKIQNNQNFESGFIDKELAQTIQTKVLDKSSQLKNNTTTTTTTTINNQQPIHVAEISGVLSMSDHELIISPPNISDSNKIIHIKEKFIWGTLSIENIIKAINSTKQFKNNGDSIEYFEINENYYLIKISSKNKTNNNNNSDQVTNIHLSPQNVNIETSCETTRRLISDIVLLNCNGFYV